MKKFAILLVILAVFTTTRTSFAQIRIKSIDVGAGVFTRAYDGNDETRMFSVFDIDGVPSIEGIRTSTQLLPSIGAEVGLADWLSLDARIGFLNKEFTASQVLTGITIEETISQRILPVSVGVKWISGDLFVDRIAYFAGAGINRYFVQNRVQRVIIGGEGSVLPATYAGNNYGAYFQAGVDYLFDNNLSIGIDGRYHTGNYVQNYTNTEGRRVSLKVPIQGFEFGLVLKYNFGSGPQKMDAEVSE
jgi:hypothetical protein